MTDPRDFERTQDFERNRPDLRSDLERNRYSPAGNNAGWIAGAVVALVLLGGWAMYAYRGDAPRTATAPASETTGQSTRIPASPRPPLGDRAPMNTPAPANPAPMDPAR